MLCIKCSKAIPDGSAYCNYCGKKQVTTAKPKYHKREHGCGTVRCDKRYKKPWIAIAPSSKYGQGRQYIGCYDTRREASEALDDFIRNGRPDLYNATLADIYEMWSKVHFKGVSESAVQLYTFMWKRFAGIKDMPIRELRTAHIQELVNAATSKSACEVIEEGYIVGGEKTEAGRDRIVPIPPSIPELKSFIADWLSSPSEKLFDISAQRFRTDIFNAALDVAGIEPKGLTPHSTRHTFASLSSSAGIKPESLQKIIGHAKFATTADIYIHQDLAKLIGEMKKITR